MLESLSSRIQGVLKDLKGEGRVSEQHLQQSMREIRLAMLEADVNFKVVRTFVSRVQEKALGKEVLQSLTPGQQIVKIVRDELTDLLGGIAAPLKFGKIPPSGYLDDRTPRQRKNYYHRQIGLLAEETGQASFYGFNRRLPTGSD